jgi:hypothetical protein
MITWFNYSFIVSYIYKYVRTFKKSCHIFTNMSEHSRNPVIYLQISQNIQEILSYIYKYLRTFKKSCHIFTNISEHSRNPVIYIQISQNIQEIVNKINDVISSFVLLLHESLPSLMAVHGAPSSCSRRISLRATRLSVSRLLPLNTVAYVPCRRK